MTIGDYTAQLRIGNALRSAHELAAAPFRSSRTKSATPTWGISIASSKALKQQTPREFRAAFSR